MQGQTGFPRGFVGNLTREKYSLIFILPFVKVVNDKGDIRDHIQDVEKTFDQKNAKKYLEENLGLLLRPFGLFRMSSLDFFKICNRGGGTWACSQLLT